MRSLTLVFFATATFLIGTAAVWIYDAGNLRGSDVLVVAIVRAVTIFVPIIFLAGAVSLRGKDS